MEFLTEKGFFPSCLGMVALIGVWWLLNTGTSNKSEESVLIVTEKEQVDSVPRLVPSKKSLLCTHKAKIKIAKGNVAPIESLPLVSVPSEKRGGETFFVLFLYFFV